MSTIAAAQKTYAEWLKTPEWRARRDAVLVTKGRKCEHCGTTFGVIDVHHISYRCDRHGNWVKPWYYDDTELEVLCRNCHDSEHKPYVQLYIANKEPSAVINNAVPLDMSAFNIRSFGPGVVRITHPPVAIDTNTFVRRVTMACSKGLQIVEPFYSVYTIDVSKPSINPKLERVQ